MFGKRDSLKSHVTVAVEPPPQATHLAVVPSTPEQPASEGRRRPAPERTAIFYDIKKEIFSAMLEAIAQSAGSKALPSA